MQSDVILQALQTMRFTRGMRPEHLAKLASIAFESNFAEGAKVFSEGDLGDVLYLIREGRVSLEMHVPGRGRITILTIGPGQILGWSAMFPHKRKTASARTLMATQAIAINTLQLREVCHQDHDFGYEVMWRVADVIADRLKATRLQVLDIFAAPQAIK